MSGDENGVATVRATRLTLAEAIRSAPRSGVLRRRRGEMALADHILAELPEHVEPTPLNPEPDTSIIEAANATIAGLNARCDELFAANRSLRERAAEDGKIIEERAESRHEIDCILDGVPGLPQDGDQAAAVGAMAERLKAAEAQNITLREALAGGHLLELADLRAKVAEYENAIAWNTSCTACARMLDSSVAEHERADKAEQAAVAMTAALERFAAPGAITATDRRKAASDALSAAQGADGEAAP